METGTPIKKRTRKRPAGVMLQQALNDASQPDLDSTGQQLIQLRIKVLSKLVEREHRDKLKRLTAEIEILKTANARLTEAQTNARPRRTFDQALAEVGEK